MHVVKPREDGAFLVGWLDRFGSRDSTIYNFVTVFETRSRYAAFVICSWLNGSTPPSEQFLEENGFIVREYPER